MPDPLVYICTLMLTFSTGYAPAQPNTEKFTDYNLSEPDTLLVLPDVLREISGLTDIDTATVACVQDENGILFIYDILENRIITQYDFGLDGDYEGITKVGNTMYVLVSDGTLLELSDYTRPDRKLVSYVTGIPASNNEGLCHDPFNNRLLIACKGKIGKGPEFKDKRVIYGFDLQTKKLSKKPVFEFNIQAIKAFAAIKYPHLPAKTRTKKGETVTEPHIKFRTSAIGIHPISRKLYLLSASDHLFFIFNMNGDIEHIEHLEPEIFNKAEGITFLDNNDMLISNEGQNGNPTLLRFNYQSN